MAILNKNDYFRRELSAGRRHIENGQKLVDKGISEEVADLISDLCSVRHKIHTNQSRIAWGEDTSTLDELVRINSELREAGFITMAFIPSYTDDYIDIDSINILQEAEDMNSDDDDWQDWVDDNLSRIMSELEELNRRIETYLDSIDKKYGTNYAPTGAQRMM